MTRHELIRLIEQSFIDYSQVPDEAEVAFMCCHGPNAHVFIVDGLRVKIVDSLPTVILI